MTRDRMSGWFVFVGGLMLGTAAAGPVFDMPRAAGHAQDAHIVTWQFGGVITHASNTSDQFIGAVEIGSPFAGVIRFDTTVKDIIPEDDVGIYPDAIVDAYGIIGELTFAGPVPSPPSPIGPRIFIGNRIHDSFWANTMVDINDASFGLTLMLNRGPATLLTSDALPVVTPDIDLFESTHFGITYGVEGSFFSASGPLTVLIPEPGTLVLLAAGAGLAGRRRRGDESRRKAFRSPGRAGDRPLHRQSRGNQTKKRSRNIGLTGLMVIAATAGAAMPSSAAAGPVFDLPRATGHAQDAHIVTWQFGGVITHASNTSDQFIGAVEIGSPFAGVIRFDTSVEDVIPEDNVGIYPHAIVDVIGVVGTLTFTGPANDDSFPPSPIGPRIFIRDSSIDSFLSNTRIEIDDFNLGFSLSLSGGPRTTFDSDALPVVPPDIDVFNWTHFGITYGIEGASFNASGPLTVLIPEPATLVLLAAGAALAGRRRRRGDESRRKAFRSPGRAGDRPLHRQSRGNQTKKRSRNIGLTGLMVIAATAGAAMPSSAAAGPVFDLPRATGHAQPAHIVTWQFGGVITHTGNTSDQFIGAVEIGSPFSGVIRFDTSVKDIIPEDDVGIYPHAIVDVFGVVGTLTFTGPANDDGFPPSPIGPRIFVANDVLDSFLSNTRVEIDGFNLGFSLSLSGGPRTTFDSDALPVVPPDIDVFNWTHFGITYGIEGASFNASGPLTVLIPEPATLVLLAAGGALAGRRRRSGSMGAPATPSRVVARIGRALAVVLMAAPGGAAAGECTGQWAEGFHLPGVHGMVFSLQVFDDGSGPGLFAGGFFTIDGVPNAANIAKWDGKKWSALETGNSHGPSSVGELVVFDDGAGPALYAAGVFNAVASVTAGRIAKWDGSVWSLLTTDFSGLIQSLAVYDDGGGPALYAGGTYFFSGEAYLYGIVKWDGTEWSALDWGLSGSIHSLAVFDDGHGPALYAGGVFSDAGGVIAHNIARWNGKEWSALESGVNGPVYALKVFDDGEGPALYAGGDFSVAGTVEAGRIARWNGSTWSALGTGMDGRVESLEDYDDGDGPALYAGGRFAMAGGQEASRIAKWNGSAWSALGLGIDGGVFALAGFDDGSGAALYAGGRFRTAGEYPSPAIAKWEVDCVDPCPPGVCGDLCCAADESKRDCPEDCFDLVDVAAFWTCLTGPGGEAAGACLGFDLDGDSDVDLDDYAVFVRERVGEP